MDYFTGRNADARSYDVEDLKRRLTSYQFPRQDFRSKMCQNMFTNSELERFRTFNGWRKSVERKAEVIEVEMWEVQNLSCSKCTLPILHKHSHHPRSRSKNCLTDLQDRITVVMHQSYNDHPRVWHPSCFHCMDCKQQFVDLVFYPLRWSQLCCARHHAELFMPRCYECDELIFTDDFIVISGKRFHKHHINLSIYQEFPPEQTSRDVEDIFHSHDTLNRQTRNRITYSPPERLEERIPNCKQCSQPIRSGKDWIKVDNNFWHSECFNCSSCSTSLIDKELVTKRPVLNDSKHSNDNMYCSVSCRDRSTTRAMGLSCPSLLTSTRTINKPASKEANKTVSSTPIKASSTYQPVEEAKSSKRFFPPISLECLSQMNPNNDAINEDGNDRITESSDGSHNKSRAYSGSNFTPTASERSSPLETSNGSNDVAMIDDDSVLRETFIVERSYMLPHSRSLTTSPVDDYYIYPESSNSKRSRLGNIIKRLTFS